MTLVLPRRRFLTGAAALFCAPALVKIGNIMPVHYRPEIAVWPHAGFVIERAGAWTMLPCGKSIDLFEVMSRAIVETPDAEMGSVRFLASREIRCEMERQSLRDKNVLLGCLSNNEVVSYNVEMQPVFRGIPIEVMT